MVRSASLVWDSRFDARLKQLIDDTNDVWGTGSHREERDRQKSNPRPILKLQQPEFDTPEAAKGSIKAS